MKQRDERNNNNKCMSGETAYINGKVYTADRDMPAAEAFVVRDGVFIAVGDNSVKEGCQNVVDLKGRCVIPGLIDSHCHLFAGVTSSAVNMLKVDPETKPEELGETLLKMANENPADENQVLVAMGIDLSKGTFSAKDLDTAFPDRAVLVYSFDGHALLLNTRAMEEVGLNRDTEDPGEHSYFVRDEQGFPTGLVIEILAMMICKDVICGQTVDKEKALEEICGEYASYGYTTVFEAMSADNEDVSLFEALEALDSKGKLPLRISTSFGYHGEEYLGAEAAFEMLKKLSERFSSEQIHPDTLKIITDGTIEEHSALMYEPYDDSPGNAGSGMVPLPEMRKAAELFSKEGFNIHIHAIGDRAVGRALDVLSGLGDIKGTKTIAHNQVYGDREKERMAAAGDIFFQTTPHWLEADEYTLKILGEDRCKRQFPLASMEREGVIISFGSDSCLEEDTANAFLGMFYAEARGDESKKGLCFPPENEGLSRASCLRAYTINGAKQLGLSSVTGSISEGKSADFVVLDRDFMECSLDELKDTRVLKTFFRGEKTFQSE